VAIVQISKIQIRRGQKNQGSGLPQLASGEMGWAIDTQELYIGNGSVAEGAPQVGNTKVVTQHDDLFDLADSYIYRNGDGAIITGIDATNPVLRTLQNRLDDRVSVRSFGVTGNSAQDCTVLLQRAIDQLYLNAGAEVSVSNRVPLYLEAGTYTIKDTIRIPPHATLIGAGSGKTIIIQENVGRSVFTTVSSESVPGSYVIDGEYTTQARNIKIEGMTLQVVDGSKGLILQSCRDSVFGDLVIVGPWSIGDIIAANSSTTFDVGLSLDSKNGGVETVRNEFTNCHIDGFSYGIVSNWDTNDNVFTTCNFSTLGYGVAFGKDMTIDGNVSNGTASGPNNNIFSDCVFTNVAKNAILIQEGTYNVSRGNKYITCGNDGGSDDMPNTSIIKFINLGNESINDYFTRTKVLAYTQGVLRTATATLVQGQLLVTVTSTADIRPGQVIANTTGVGSFGSNPVVVSVDSLTQFTVNTPHVNSGAVSFELRSPIIGTIPYVPEVEGPCNFEWGFEHEVTVLDGDAVTLFRLPQFINQSFDIDYLAVAMQGYTGTRSGKLRIVVNSIEDAPNGTPDVQVSDDYDYIGDELYLDKISFSAILSDVDADTNFDTVVIKSNASGMPTNARTQFKFKVKTKQSNL
tara:strand:+ start:1765 stop:3660 length:1896 start_codon:yes stop_codon:yes gene_type:complete